MRVSKISPLTLTNQFKRQILHWAQQFDDVVWLDSNTHNTAYNSYDAILAVDAFTAIKTDATKAFTQLEDYQKTTKDWLFGYLSYDLKNDVEAISSKNNDGSGFPELLFFQPKRLFLFKDNTVEIKYLRLVDDEIESDWEAITNFNCPQDDANVELKIKLRTSKDSYFETLETMLAHIHRGDIYEANFCQEFYANGSLKPVATYLYLNDISRPPMACFFKHQNLYALCASPERYLKKIGPKVISQPIKGTAKRSSIEAEDERLKLELAGDEKEISENVMIVDLVRNDLSKTAEKGSVTVEELCKVYSFAQVHQLISTITATVSKEVLPTDVLRSSFPMGSMTGAPKISAMRIIEALEDAKRGLYSGAIGYFTPDDDFDFNVVIRSILYNASKAYISFSVGGAITAKSNPEAEYEECLIKAKAMRDALLGNREDSH